ADDQIGSGKAGPQQADVGSADVGSELGGRARPGDRRCRPISGNLGKQACRVRPAGPRRMQGICVSLEAFSVWAMPALDGSGRPCGGLVGVAVVAGIRGAEPGGEVRTRDAEAVIVPLIDDHVGACGHVTGRAGQAAVVTMVALGGIRLGGVALSADTILGKAKLGAMRLMAITAGYAGGKHLALLERAIVVDLIKHLAVGLIDAATDRRNGMRLRQPSTRQPVLGELSTPSMTKAAGLRLFAQGEGQFATRGIAGLCLHRPGNVATFIEA